MSALMEKIFIFGASGHAKVVMDIVERQGLYEIAFLIDDNPALKDAAVFGYKVLGCLNDIIKLREVYGISKCVIAIGSNKVREKLDHRLATEGFSAVSAVHPSAQIGRGATIGEGTVVMAGALINSDARIGRNVIINTGAAVDHDCVIEDHVHIAPGVRLCGNVRVGVRSLVGVGASVTPNISIGHDVIVGAGSTVLNDIHDGVTAVGSPAKVKNNDA